MRGIVITLLTILTIFLAANRFLIGSTSMGPREVAMVHTNMLGNMGSQEETRIIMDPIVCGERTGNYWNTLEDQKGSMLFVSLGNPSADGVVNTRSGYIQRVRPVLDSITGTQPPESGDWIINDMTVVEDCILIINGSIIVNSTGALILRNSEIYMNLSYDGEHHIDVYGNLTVVGGLITAYHTENNYFIRIFSGAKLRIEDSEISYSGYEFGTNGDRTGLWIETSNATITNSTIHHNYYGIYMHYADNNTIVDTEISNNHFTGINIRFSSNNTIMCCNITKNSGEGILLIFSDNNTIAYCNIASYYHGITLSSSDFNIIRNNSFTGVGLFVRYSHNNKVLNNTVNGKQLIYLENKNDIMITGDLGQVILVSCVNITVKYLDISNTNIGVELWESNNVTIMNCSLTNNDYGAYVGSSYNVTITHNNATGNDQYGVYLYISHHNLVIHNNMTGSGNGLGMQHSDWNIIQHNYIARSYYGIYLVYSDNNTFTTNNIENSDGSAVYLWGSNGNIIFLNNILDPVMDYEANIFDNGTYGNYWGFGGVDTDHDWIMDSPYQIDNNSTDNKPLLYPIEAFIYPNRDFDKDYMDNREERAYGTNPYSTDSDQDGLSDPSEIKTYFTDPLMNDTDMDGIPDGWEIRYGLNPLNASDRNIDYDGDTLSNLQEYNYGTNPNIADTDSDNMPDGWEIRNGLNPLNSSDAYQDPDSDFLSNREEYIHRTNPLDADSDDDSLPDGWEVAYGLDPLTINAAEDPDGDGLTNFWEYQYFTNPTLADTDADGLPDGWEVAYGLNPLNSSDSSFDPDDDGLSNIREFWFGTNPLSSDSDDDGYNDGVEVRFGTDPNDPNDYPTSTATTVVETTIVTETKSLVNTETLTTFVEGMTLNGAIAIGSLIVAMLAIVLLITTRKKPTIS